MRRRAAIAAVAVAALGLCFPAGGCGKGRRDVSRALIVDARTLYEQARGHLERRDLGRARRVLERIEYTAENRAEAEPLVRLLLADVAFYERTDPSLIDARSLYLDFVTLYADHPMAPYAQLQAGICYLYQSNNPSRDQSATSEAIQELREVLRRYPDSPFARAARDKIDEAQAKIAEHEFIVGRFYLSKKAYKAAATRLKRVLEEYPRYPEKDKIFVHLGEALLGDGDQSEGKFYLDKVVSEYPEGRWAGQARKLLSKTEAG